MNIGIVNLETWAFFKEVYAELERHHTISQFKPHQVNLPVFNERINRSIFQRGLEDFLRTNQVVFFEWASELLAAASHLPKTCVIVTRLHRYEMYQWVNQVNWDNVDRIILVSEAKRQEFATRFPYQAEKLVVIPESIPLEKFPLLDKPYHQDLGILCNLTPRKRVYELILAFAGQELDKLGFHLHIGGGEHPRFGDYYTALDSLVHKLKLQDKVTFYGHIKDALSFYRNVDIFISNSFNEGLQVSPMEAIASGCYCFSHWWAGAEELLPEENLFLTDIDLRSLIISYDRLSNQAKQLCREKIRNNVVERFDSAKISHQIRAVVEEAAVTIPKEQKI